MNRTGLGKVGVDVNTDRALEAARSAAINMLATIREALDTLDRVERVVNSGRLTERADASVEASDFFGCRGATRSDGATVLHAMTPRRGRVLK